MRFVNRRWWLLEQVRGKRVLDVGCVGPDDGGLHKEIAKIAAHAVGIDINEGGIKKLRSLGYIVEVENAESFDLNEKFDIVVAGDLIEHLSNPGLFLDCARQHLTDDGKLVLTTPNPLKIANLVKNIPPSPGHVAMFDHVLIERLLDRHGFRVAEKIYCDEPTSWGGNCSAN